MSIAIGSDPVAAGAVETLARHIVSDGAARAAIALARAFAEAQIDLDRVRKVRRHVLGRLVADADDGAEREVDRSELVRQLRRLERYEHRALARRRRAIRAFDQLFVAGGVLVGESPILTRHIDEQLRGLIVCLFMPVFFGLSGLNADLTILKSPDLLLLTDGLVVIASIGKFAGAFVGGTLGRLSQREAFALAYAMNARGSTELIVATVGLSMGVLRQNLYTMIVTMAVVTTVAMPPMLRWALMRIPIGDEERIRLEREELDARGFVPNLERLLLAADDSPNGKFASRLAALIAGSGKKPITVLDLSENGPSSDSDRADQQHEEMESTAEAVAAPEATANEEKPDKANVTTRPKRAQPHEAVAREALKGYGLLVVGIENTRSPDGGFTPDITLIIAGFQGAIAVVAGRGPQVARALEPGSKILVPANGTEAARRAAEIALVMAKSTRTSITALYVASGSGTESKRKRPRRGSATRRNEEAILKEIVELADRYDIQVRTAMRVDVAAEDAILREARRI